MTAATRLGRSVAAAIAGLAALSACGGADGTFTAEEFVAEANDHGAGLVLGPPLESGREETTIYELSFEEVDHQAGGEDVHGGGSLTVLADAEAGVAEWERCERAVSLICFRAANVALIFDGNLSPDDIARLEESLLSMESS